MNLDCTVIILTFNEGVHIERCLDKVSGFATETFVIDCYSTDDTVKRCELAGVQVVQRKWPGNQAAQFNWALENLPIKTKWVLRLDADEYLTSELIDEINEKVPSLASDVNGVTFLRKHVFLGRTMQHGVGNTALLRLFKYGKAICEQRLMDEHIQLLEGKCVEFRNHFFDHNLNDLAWWTTKHNGYALRETLEMLDMEFDLRPSLNVPQSGIGLHAADAAGLKVGGLAGQAAAKRAKKLKYMRLPIFWRSSLYFIVRYILKGGFLDGKEGFLWHFLQGWWYRTLVDARIFEIKKNCGNDPIQIKKYLLDRYKIDCSKANPFEKG